MTLTALPFAIGFQLERLTNAANTATRSGSPTSARSELNLAEKGNWQHAISSAENESTDQSRQEVLTDARLAIGDPKAYRALVHSFQSWSSSHPEESLSFLKQARAFRSIHFNISTLEDRWLSACGSWLLANEAAAKAAGGDALFTDMKRALEQELPSRPSNQVSQNVGFQLASLVAASDVAQLRALIGSLPDSQLVDTARQAARLVRTRADLNRLMQELSARGVSDERLTSEITARRAEFGDLDALALAKDFPEPSSKRNVYLAGLNSSDRNVVLRSITSLALLPGNHGLLGLNLLRSDQNLTTDELFAIREGVADDPAAAELRQIVDRRLAEQSEHSTIDGKDTLYASKVVDTLSPLALAENARISAPTGAEASRSIMACLELGAQPEEIYMRISQAADSATESTYLNEWIKLVSDYDPAIAIRSLAANPDRVTADSLRHLVERIPYQKRDTRNYWLEKINSADGRRDLITLLAAEVDN